MGPKYCQRNEMTERPEFYCARRQCLSTFECERALIQQMRGKVQGPERETNKRAAEATPTGIDSKRRKIADAETIPRRWTCPP
eukprot:10275702-Alexandrium_andersonii.AAC.1